MQVGTSRPGQYLKTYSGCCHVKIGASFNKGKMGIKQALKPFALALHRHPIFKPFLNLSLNPCAFAGSTFVHVPF